jgi:TolA-binding protein
VCKQPLTCLLLSAAGTCLLLSAAVAATATAAVAATATAAVAAAQEVSALQQTLESAAQQLAEREKLLMEVQATLDYRNSKRQQQQLEQRIAQLQQQIQQVRLLGDPCCLRALACLPSCAEAPLAGPLHLRPL